MISVVTIFVWVDNFDLSHHSIIQLMVDGVITETGQNVQLIVGEEHKPEPGHVQTQLQLMVVQIVLGRQLKLKTATLNLVQVNIA